MPSPPASCSGLWVALVLAFLFGPIAVIALYAFNASNIQTWPIPGFSLRWFASAWSDREIRGRAGAVAGGRRLSRRPSPSVLGTAAAFAVHRFRFVGREAVSFVLVLPIALPGIITGMALNSFFAVAGTGLSFWTIVIGHATFCIVVVYNNVLARLRRMPASLGEASMDLGADGWRTLPARHPAADLDRAGRRRHPGLRAVLRRGDRHDLHGRRAEHAAALDLRRHPARAAPARGQCRGAARHRPHLRAGAAGLPADAAIRVKKESA